MDIKRKPRPGGLPLVLVAKDRDEYCKILGIDDKSRGRFRYKIDSEGKWSENAIYSYVKFPHETEFERFYGSVLVHEGVHQILQQYAGFNRIPNLINEGIASYFQDFDVFNPGSPLKSTYLRNIRGPLVKEDILKISDLFDSSPWDVDNFGRMTNLKYYNSQMYIAYQLKTERGRSELLKLISQAFDGKINKSDWVRNTDANQHLYSMYVTELLGPRIQ